MATRTGEQEIGGAVSGRVGMHMYGTGPKAFQLSLVDYEHLTFKTPFLLKFPLSQPHMYKNTGNHYFYPTFKFMVEKLTKRSPERTSKRANNLVPSCKPSIKSST